MPDLLAPFATFAAYAVVAVLRRDETLLSAKAFASLSLVVLLSAPLLSFCQALPTFMQGLACLRRIEGFFCHPSLRETELPTLDDEGPRNQGASLGILESGNSTADVLVTFHNASFSFSSQSEPVLHDLSMSVQPGFTVIIGPVASGKSTLLNSLMSEAHLTGGEATSHLSKLAYCPQTPWITSNTIRNNIVGHSQDFDPKWYDFVLTTCQLQHDLAMMPLGDQTHAGSHGSALSGGQKQRVVSSDH
jgi:ABC-type multidrug transport system fused ATPase/permease subunit